MSADLKIFNKGDPTWDLSKSVGSIIAVIAVIAEDETIGYVDTTHDEIGGGTVFAVPLIYTDKAPPYTVDIESDGRIKYRKQKGNLLAIGVFS